MHFRTAPPEPGDPLHRLWLSAATTTNQADPFCCSPAWQLSFHAAFAPERRLFVETSAQSLIAFAETAVSPDNIYLTPIEPHWFFACPLLGKEAVSLLARSMVFFAGAYRPFFPKIIISGIRPGGVLSRRLIRDFADDFALYLHSVGIQSAASLHGGVDGYLSRRSGGHRSKLKKAARRANEQGVSFERVIPASAQEASATYARMLAVEERSWKGIGQCGMAEPPARQFYEILLQRLAGRKAARIIFARHEGEDIGFIFGGKAGNIYRGQQFSFSAQWGKYSIGNLMQMEQIGWLCEEGAKRYDMGPLDGPRMEYKSHWTEKAMEIQTWVLVPKG